MGKYFLGAISSSNKETRILQLKAYLNNATNYRSDIALNKAGIKSWPTFIKYLMEIKYNTQQFELNNLGQKNLKIALREANFLKEANKRAKH